MKNIFYYESSVGPLGIVSENGAITEILFGKKKLENTLEEETPIIKQAIEELGEYFDGRRKCFSVKMNPHGTDFQKKVWTALLKIPYGQTKSYKEIAQMCGNENASRAVGMANNKNPIPIMIPCHRVIGSNGDLTGYAGGLDIKKTLLERENHI